MNLTGRSLGKYQLVERLGQGGMAQVYKAYQPTIERFVAVKVLYSHLAEDEEFLQRFKREAKGLGQLRHPHIVNVIDFDYDDGWYYMVMDYIKGITLRAYLDQKKVLPAAEALRIAAQMADALDYAHRQGSIHRDVKPENVMFADEASSYAVITDFGIARLLDNVTLTASGVIAGTPAYISPEAAQGEKVDGRTDVYSLGVVLYEMVTGRTPYQGDTPLSLILKKVTEPLPPPLELNPDLPLAIDEVLQKSLAKLPAERYQSAADMLRAIERVQATLGGARAAGTPEAPEADTFVLARGPARVPASDQVGAPLPAAPAGDLSAARMPRRWILAGVAAVLVVALLAAGGLALTRGDRGEVSTATIPVPVETPVDQSPAEAPPAQTVVVPSSVGSLRFADGDGTQIRRFTMALDGVPAPPPNFHYELWLRISGQPASQRVGELPLEGGRIRFDGELDETMVAGVSGLLISIEPDFDDDPSISTDIAFEGERDAAARQSEIRIFAARR